jgi:hypothetical protein
VQAIKLTSRVRAKIASDAKSILGGYHRTGSQCRAETAPLSEKEKK